MGRSRKLIPQRPTDAELILGFLEGRLTEADLDEASEFLGFCTATGTGSPGELARSIWAKHGGRILSRTTADMLPSHLMAAIRAYGWPDGDFPAQRAAHEHTMARRKQDLLNSITRGARGVAELLNEGTTHDK